jgi:hypothetical protein
MRRLGHDLQIFQKMYSQICRNDFLEMMVFTKTGKPRDALQLSKLEYSHILLCRIQIPNLI